MATKKSSAKKRSAKKASAKKVTSKKTTAKKTASTKKRTTRKSAARKRAPRRLETGMLEAKVAAAAEPPIDRDLTHLLPAFRVKLEVVLDQLRAEGTPFKFNEGYRSPDRQQWLWGSGRPNAVPYGRKGPVVTHKDGVRNLSNHQGNGTVGTGQAADCYPAHPNGKIIWPPPKANDPRWKRYADLALAQGLDAGFYWKKFPDQPHIELKS